MQKKRGKKMVRIIMNGCNGHMGRVISELVEKDENAEIAAGIDVADMKIYNYPVYTNVFDCDKEADVMIDFSSPKATDKRPNKVITNIINPATITESRNTSSITT